MRSRKVRLLSAGCRIVACLAVVGFAMTGRAGVVFSDGMDYANDAALRTVWTNLYANNFIKTAVLYGPTPLAAQSGADVPASGKYMAMGNGVSSAELGTTITNDWSLTVKVLHRNYSRSQSFYLLDSTGSQGYGVVWGSGSVNQYDGNGVYTIRKFDNSTHSDWGTFGTGGQSGSVLSGSHPVTGYEVTAAPSSDQNSATYDTSSWADFVTLRLDWSATSGALELYEDGTLVGQTTNTSFSSFSRIYLRGNTDGYFDDVEVSVPDAAPEEEYTVLSDGMDYANDTELRAVWTNLYANNFVKSTVLYGPTPLAAQSGADVPASGKYMAMGNGVSYAKLGTAITNDWSLSVKLLHRNYSRSMCIFLLDSTGSEGYGMSWASALVSQYGGNGYYSVRKFNNPSHVDWSSFGAGTDLSGNVQSGHPVTGYAVTNAPTTAQNDASYDTSSWADFVSVRLDWSAATGTLSLYENGSLVKQVIDTDFSSFSRVYLRGNTDAYFDDVELTVAGEALAGYELWAQNYSLAGGALDDDDGDGFSNLEEFGLGGNPKSSGTIEYEPSSGMNGDGFEVVHVRRTTADNGLVYYLEQDIDLVAAPGWTNMNNYVITGTNALPSDPDFEAITNRFSTAGENSLFVRVRIEMVD